MGRLAGQKPSLPSTANQLVDLSLKNPNSTQDVDKGGLMQKMMNPSAPGSGFTPTLQRPFNPPNLGQPPATAGGTGARGKDGNGVFLGY